MPSLGHGCDNGNTNEMLLSYAAYAASTLRKPFHIAVAAPESSTRT